MPLSHCSDGVLMLSPQTSVHVERFFTKPFKVSLKFEPDVCRSAWKSATS